MTQITCEEEARAFCAARVAEGGMERLEILARELTAENARQNLVASQTLATVWTRHFADSLQLLDFFDPRSGDSWLDLGTGAGFPGLAIAAARPELAITMVESRRRRCEWLSHAATAMGLENAVVKATRLENFDTLPFTAISARAFAPLDRLLHLSARFSTTRTVWLLPKGRSAGQEISGLPPKAKKMFHVEQSVTDPEAGIIVGKGRPEGYL